MTDTAVKSRYDYKIPKQLIVIGDLNANVHALRRLLSSLEIIDQQDRWIKSDVHVVQLGDILNRGEDSKQCLDLLMKWESEAQEVNSYMTTILGNHEVMVLLGNYEWCYPEEFMAFAEAHDIEKYSLQRHKKLTHLLQEAAEQTHISILGELRAWECQNCVGFENFKDNFSASGKYGKWLRQRPAVIKVGSYILSHAGLLSEYAELGLERLNNSVSEDWEEDPQNFEELADGSLLCAGNGPLWNRQIATLPIDKLKQEIEDSLSFLKAEMMIVGHTRTEAIGGTLGRLLVREGGRILCADTSIGTPGIAPTAALIENNTIYEWCCGQKSRIEKVL